MTARIKVSAVIFAAMAVITPAIGQTTDTASKAAKAPAITAVAPVTDQQIQAALAELDTYDYGKERGFLLVIDAQIRQSAGKEKQRQKLANALTERAVNGSLAYGARDLALRRLAEIGKGAQVEKLEALLTDKDERISEMARQTISEIPGERSNKALMKALTTSSGKLREGIINSLGQRQVKGAVKELTKIARQDNGVDARAAMLALGKIASAESGRALLNDIRPQDAVRETWFIAMNDAAIGLTKNHQKLARRLFDRVVQMAGDSPARLAAFKGRALLEEHPEAIALKALDEEDPGLAQVATELLVRGSDPSITPQLVSRLESAAPDKKVAVLEILGARGDKSVLDAVSQLAQRPTADNPGLQVAALLALENLANQSSVPMLVKVAADGNGDVAKAAETTLIGIPLPEVDSELFRLISEAATPDEKVVAIETAVGRKSDGAMEKLAQAAAVENDKVASAAFKAIAQIGSEKEFAPTLTTLVQVKNGKVLREGARTVAALAKKFNDPSKAADQVATAFAASDNNDVKTALLGILAKLGGDKALQTIRQELASSDEKMRDAAIRALADFPGASAMDDLLKIAAESQSDVHRVLAVRGVARLLAEPSVKPSAEVIATATRALELATAPAEKKAVIGALADVKVPCVLPLILPFLDQPEFKDESAVAVIKQASIANLIDPTTTAELLNPLKSKLTPDQWNDLEETLTPSESGEKAVRAYQATKAYSLEDNTSVTALLQQQFEPEVGEGDWPLLVWAGVDESGDKVGKADLKNYYADNSNVAAYLRFHVWSSEDQAVRLDTGSDDGLRAWVNGTQVFADDEPRGHSWWGDQTKVNLKRGWNSVMLKIGQGSVAWDVAARIVNDAGKPVPGLKYSAMPQTE